MDYVHTTVETMTNEELQSYLQATRRNISHWADEQQNTQREIDRRALKVYFDANPDQMRIDLFTGDDLLLINNRPRLDWRVGHHVTVSAISWHTGTPEYILSDGSQLGWGFSYYELIKMRDAFIKEETQAT